MFLIKSLNDLLKVGSATLEGTIPRVAQLEADEQLGNVNYLAGCGRRRRLRGGLWL